MKEKPRHDEHYKHPPVSDERLGSHPLDFLERMFAENGWEFSRPSADSFSTITRADWTEYCLNFEWQRFSQVLSIACAPTLTIPEAKRAFLSRLVDKVNLELWFGRFEFLPYPSKLQFRYGVPLYMLDDQQEEGQKHDKDHDHDQDQYWDERGASDALFCSRVARLLESILGLCERYYPAFRYALAEEEPSSEEMRLALSAAEGRA